MDSDVRGGVFGGMQSQAFLFLNLVWPLCTPLSTVIMPIFNMRKKKTECLRIPLEFPKVSLNISITFQTQGAFCTRPVQMLLEAFVLESNPPYLQSPDCLQLLTQDGIRDSIL